MNHDDLNALPEWPTGFSHESRVVDGRTVISHVPLPLVTLQAADGEERWAVDAEGGRWMLGWYGGVRYKMRSLSTL